MALCLSVTSRRSIQRNERINLVFGTEAPFRSVLHCGLRKFGYLQKYGCFPLELFPERWI